jgi:hypothetical protein
MPEEPLCCITCGGDSDDCGCWGCPACGGTLSSEDSRCSRCDSCSACCECFCCDRCSRMRDADAQCGICSQCANCCDCNRCESCSDYFRNGGDTGFCHSCSSCENCCTCWVCDSCDDRYGDSDYRCLSCDHCEECCSCIHCGGCSSRVLSFCEGCLRCDSCVCNCSSEPLCAHCYRRGQRCLCNTCYQVDQTTGVISGYHSYSGAACSDCETCRDHCRATLCPVDGCLYREHKLCRFCLRCPTCCRCVICMCKSSHLIEAEEQACAVCRRCESHCVCPTCSACSNKGIWFCDWCKHCPVCCTAEDSECGAYGLSEPVIHRKLAMVKFIPTAEQMQINPNPRLIGVEIETNKLRSATGVAKAKKLRSALDVWKDDVVDDGSIGSGPGVFELVAKPSGGDLFLDHMKEVTEGLSTMTCYADSSCGLHVHIDASDITEADLLRVALLYAKVERALFSLCDTARRTGSYSRPCGATYAMLANEGVKAFRRKLTDHLYFSGKGFTSAKKLVNQYVCSLKSYGVKMGAEEFEALPAESRMSYILYAVRKHRAIASSSKSSKYHSSRYRALNLHSYYLRRTVEFRHHEGTTDYEVITNWAMICQELITCALRMTPEQIDALPRNSGKALLGIMPERLHPFIKSTWAKYSAYAESLEVTEINLDVTEE